MESNEKITLTKTESRAAHAAQWLVTALIFVNAGFALFSFREISHIGVRWVVFGAALCVASVLIAAAFIVLFLNVLFTSSRTKTLYRAFDRVFSCGGG